jgi:hypothetical protein
VRRTPFHAWHKAQGGRLVEFAGWEMPVTFAGILEEHRTVRERVGVFDVSHMARIEVRGRGAEAFLNRVAANDVSRLTDDQLLYTPVCLPSGGVVDDVTICGGRGDRRSLGPPRAARDPGAEGRRRAHPRSRPEALEARLLPSPRDGDRGAPDAPLAERLHGRGRIRGVFPGLGRDRVRREALRPRRRARHRPRRPGRARHAALRDGLLPLRPRALS